ncbi:hypothetical protein XM38_051110 [Halomicronema hongdechloris C2206]|uniref:Uncharacterized protein n=1 Tax=Halomicronema hongdechloris C2206 TaxID=1641165 RepID=A0A1Z3HV31_9CYAN|nr:hypothetical protein XM38_051110 [Halomicronema hongdechloris C2206]
MRAIAAYPDDRPYPSYLMFDMVNQRPIHVVAAKDNETQTVYVVTAHEPDANLWQPDFKTRKRP